MSTSTAQRPWYREPWPWILMLPPLGAVLGGFAILALAIGSPDALVVDDYAHIEDLTRARFAADRRAAELDVRAVVELAHDGANRTRLAVRLEGGPAFTSPQELQLRLRHAAHADADREALLVRGGTVYVGHAELAAGRYTLELAPPGGEWRLAGSVSEIPAVLAFEAPPSAGDR